MNNASAAPLTCLEQPRGAEPYPVISVAPIIRRVLAFFVDYLCLLTFSSLAGYLRINPDFEFLFLFIVAGVYFSLSQSVIFGGQSLGKRCFGIYVANVSAVDRSPPGLLRSTLRYLAAVGILILLTQIPNLLYRHFAYVAPSAILELHMLPALCYTLADFLALLLTSRHRTLHDFIAGTEVCAMPDQTIHSIAASTEKRISSFDQKKLLLSIAIGIIAGFILWRPGVTTDSVISPIVEHRYVVEHLFAVRVVGVERAESDVLITLALAPNYQDRHNPDFTKIAANLSTFFKMTRLLDSGTISVLRYQFIPSGPNDRSGAFDLQYEVQTSDGSIKKSPVNQAF